MKFRDGPMCQVRVPCDQLVNTTGKAIAANGHGSFGEPTIVVMSGSLTKWWIFS
jgi:hypothetical protein